MPNCKSMSSSHSSPVGRLICSYPRLVIIYFPSWRERTPLRPSTLEPYPLASR